MKGVWIYRFCTVLLDSQQRVVATVEESVLKTEMTVLESQEEDDPMVGLESQEEDDPNDLTTQPSSSSSP